MESAENAGEAKENSSSEEETRKNILADLDAHVPWQEIAKKYHVSTKTISKIRDEAAGGPNNRQRLRRVKAKSQRRLSIFTEMGNPQLTW